MNQKPKLTQWAKKRLAQIQQEKALGLHREDLLYEGYDEGDLV